MAPIPPARHARHVGQNGHVPAAAGDKQVGSRRSGWLGWVSNVIDESWRGGVLEGERVIKVDIRQVCGSQRE